MTYEGSFLRRGRVRRRGARPARLELRASLLDAQVVIASSPSASIARRPARRERRLLRRVVYLALPSPVRTALNVPGSTTPRVVLDPERH